MRGDARMQTGPWWHFWDFSTGASLRINTRTGLAITDGKMYRGLFMEEELFERPRLPLTRREVESLAFDSDTLAVKWYEVDAVGRRPPLIMIWVKSTDVGGRLGDGYKRVTAVYYKPVSSPLTAEKSVRPRRV